MAVDVTLDHSDLGLAGSLFDGCLNLFIALRKAAHGSNVLSEIQNKLLSQQLEEFLLWGDGFGATKGDLDAVLIHPDSSRLNTLVLQLLGAIGHTLVDKFMAILESGSHIDSQFGEQRAFVTGLLEKADYISLGELYDPDCSDSESKASSVEVPEIAVDDVISDLTTYMQSLADTTPALELAARRPHPQSRNVTRFTTRPLDFNVSEVAKPYCRKINDRFPKASIALVERFGEANAERHRRIREGFDEIDVDPEGKHDRAKTEAGTTFYDSALGPSLISNEHYDDRATSHPPRSASAMSEATFTSLFTDKGSTSLRVPPLPKEALEGESFVCVICKRLIEDVSSRIEWKKHVFRDLKPYMCTFDACPSTSMFSSRRDWWAHETEVHRWEVTWLCTHCPKVFKEQSQFDSHLHTINEGQPAHSSATKMPAASKKYSAQNFKEQVCPICFDFTGNTSLSFAKHVGKHMEEIALAVISHVAEDDDARDSERFSDLGSEQESDCGNEQNVRSFLECAEVGAFDEDLSPLSETNTSPSDQKKSFFLRQQQTPSEFPEYESPTAPNLLTPEELTAERKKSLVHNYRDYVAGNSEIRADPNRHHNRCTHCPSTFPSDSMLKKHVLSTHTRPFICTFQRYGCKATVGSKNEWKRHINVQHLHLETWRCDLEPCNQEKQKNSTPSTVASLTLEKKASPTEARDGFDRKDMFTQHMKRMHAPPKSASHVEWVAFEASLGKIQDRCHRQLRSPPSRSKCPYCPDKVFEGPGSWSDRLEHVGKHLEKNDVKKEDEVEDEDVRDWMVQQGFMEWKAHMGYKVINSDGKKKRNKSTVITSEDEKDAEGEEED